MFGQPPSHPPPRYEVHLSDSNLPPSRPAYLDLHHSPHDHTYIFDRSLIFSPHQNFLRTTNHPKTNPKIQSSTSKQTILNEKQKLFLQQYQSNEEEEMHDEITDQVPTQVQQLFSPNVRRFMSSPLSPNLVLPDFTTNHKKPRRPRRPRPPLPVRTPITPISPPQKQVFFTDKTLNHCADQSSKAPLSNHPYNALISPVSHIRSDPSSYSMATTMTTSFKQSETDLTFPQTPSVHNMNNNKNFCNNNSDNQHSTENNSSENTEFTVNGSDKIVVNVQGSNKRLRKKQSIAKSSDDLSQVSRLNMMKKRCSTIERINLPSPSSCEKTRISDKKRLKINLLVKILWLCVSIVVTASCLFSLLQSYWLINLTTGNNLGLFGLCTSMSFKRSTYDNFFASPSFFESDSFRSQQNNRRRITSRGKRTVQQRNYFGSKLHRDNDVNKFVNAKNVYVENKKSQNMKSYSSIKDNNRASYDVVYDDDNYFYNYDDKKTDSNIAYSYTYEDNYVDDKGEYRFDNENSNKDNYLHKKLEKNKLNKNIDFINQKNSKKFKNRRRFKNTNNHYSGNYIINLKKDLETFYNEENLDETEKNPASAKRNLKMKNINSRNRDSNQSNANIEINAIANKRNVSITDDNKRENWKTEKNDRFHENKNDENGQKIASSNFHEERICSFYGGSFRLSNLPSNSWQVGFSLVSKVCCN